MPQDVFVNICEWLSVRDILALRMANKCIAKSTRQSSIWVSLLRRLRVPLPILPATSRYQFGEILPSTYEWLMRRALYLEQNWRRTNPVGAHSRFQTHGRTIVMKMLPGGKYMVTVVKNPASFSLVIWDLDVVGARVALIHAASNTPFLKLEVNYATVKNANSAHRLRCIVIAYAKPPITEETEAGDKGTQVQVVSVPLIVLEEMADRRKDGGLFRTAEDSLEIGYRVIHESWTSCDVGQLALDSFNGELVLLVVHRPRALTFHYVTSYKHGNLLLGPVRPFEALKQSIWAVKLLPSQNSVLVSRVLVEHGVNMDSTLFVLDIFLLPGPGSAYKHPMTMGRQLISGMRVDGFYFSNLESSWFASLHDPEGLLPAPCTREPPPISIFITTKEPRGVIHCLLLPQPVPYEFLELPFGRGTIPHYAYSLPMIQLEKFNWGDDYARPVIIPGAYRSIIFMRPHIRPELQEAGTAAAAANGMEVLRFCAHATRAEEYEKYATPRTTGHFHTEDGMDVDDDTNTMVLSDENTGIRKRSMRIPETPNELAWSMMHGTTAVAWDESVGKLCIATVQDTDVHVLDFGGENWEVAEVEAV
ncbi:hypothetical protein K439DRAFT_1634093 [Ramaria rubella]|nr:hypothetical protein K439DRAFT_1634093 [Ramaria rubella]